MNRRTFLKLSGIAITSTIAPMSLFDGTPNHRWINIFDQLPGLHQKFIMIHQHEEASTNKEIHISIGEVVKIEKASNDILTISEEYAYFIFDDDGPIFVHSNNKEKIASVINQWFDIKDRPIEEVSSTLSIYKFDSQSVMINTDFRVHWIPVNGEYPTTLPPIPKSMGHQRYGRVSDVKYYDRELSQEEIKTYI